MTRKSTKIKILLFNITTKVFQEKTNKIPYYSLKNKKIKHFSKFSFYLNK